ncbi:MAG: hypothetical protein ACFFB5_13675 [Promethearchaeota archaeon]
MNTGKKTQWGSISLLLLLFMISLNLHSIILNPISYHALNHAGNERILSGSEITSDYTPTFTGNGENCNITLQQSLIESSPITVTNTSDPLNNTFYEPCPTTENFPSSLVNMTIEEIYAPNKTLIIEEGINQGNEPLSGYPEATSFWIKGNGYLENVSVYLRNLGTNSATIRIDLFSSEWNSTESRSQPVGVALGTQLGLFTIGASSEGWMGVTRVHEFLNISNTENKTWFIAVFKSGPGTHEWRFTRDDANGDNSESYFYNTTVNKWQLRQDVFKRTRDYHLKVDLSPSISPPNQTLIVEDGPDNNYQQFDDVVPAASSFEVRDNCFLENVSVELYNPYSPENITVRLALFNSTWNSSDMVSKPGGLKNDFIQDLGIIDYSTSLEWITLRELHIYLDNSKTENNTWFIGLFTIISSLHEGYWEWNWISQGNGVDDTRSYTYQTFPSTKWILAEAFSQKVDFHLKLDLHIIDDIPSKIGLKINDNPVTGHNTSYGAGFWLSIDQYSNPSGTINFTLSADWWDVSCTITSVQIIYTKTDGKANSNFTVGSEQEVLWHVTDTEGLNYLDPRINETAMINFTIPSSWYNINVFNGTINRTDDVSVRILNNGYSEIYVLNAGSGDWYLTASSENLVASIDSYLGSEPENVVNYSDIVHFNVSFKETIFQNDGLINLSIYSPAPINDVLNFTLVKTTFNSGQEFSLGDWDVSDTVIQYGVFRVQVSWHNGIAVGFLEVSLTIIGESNLLLIEPPQNAIFDPDQQFTIILYYEDTHLHKAIDGAVIEYNIAAQGWEATTLDNGTIGFSLIPVDCSELSSSGSKRVDITATHEFYSTPTLEYIFEISESPSTTTTTGTTTTSQPDTSTTTTTTTTTTTSQPDTSTTTTTTTTTTTSQPDTSSSTTTTTTSIHKTTSKSSTTTTRSSTFPGVLQVCLVFGFLIVFIRRRKKR